MLLYVLLLNQGPGLAIDAGVGLEFGFENDAYVWPELVYGDDRDEDKNGGVDSKDRAWGESRASTHGRPQWEQVWWTGT